MNRTAPKCHTKRTLNANILPLIPSFFIWCYFCRLHKNLVCSFFKNASRMLKPKGQVHVSHKTTFPFNSWDIVELASQSDLSLLRCVEFKREDYPGYNNKRGAGPRSDKPFPLGECCTFKFILATTKKSTDANESGECNVGPSTVPLPRLSDKPKYPPTNCRVLKYRPPSPSFPLALSGVRLAINTSGRQPTSPYFLSIASIQVFSFYFLKSCTLNK